MIVSNSACKGTKIFLYSQIYLHFFIKIFIYLHISNICSNFVPKFDEYGKNPNYRRRTRYPQHFA